MNNSINIGLSAFDKESIIKIFSSNKRIEKVFLFGSRAKGNFRPGSDIDLAVSGNNLSLNDILDLSIELDTLELPYKFDIILLKKVKEKALLEHINRLGIVLFEKDV